MENNEEKLLVLIQSYVNDVQYFTELLNIRTEIHKGFQVTERIGHFDEQKEIYYSFHGPGGVFLKDKFREVDFDVFDEGRTDGFRTWFLINYIDSNSHLKDIYESLADFEIMEVLLENLTIKGVLNKKDDGLSDTYYFWAGITPSYFKTYHLNEEQFSTWLNKEYPI